MDIDFIAEDTDAGSVSITAVSSKAYEKYPMGFRLLTPQQAQKEASDLRGSGFTILDRTSATLGATCATGPYKQVLCHRPTLLMDEPFGEMQPEPVRNIYIEVK